MNRLIKCSIIIVISIITVSCSHTDPDNPPSPDKPIVVLFDNDVHSAMEGYTVIAGLRDAMTAADTANIAVVSSGDYLQGGVLATISHGEYPARMIEAVGYDAIAPGNHEFDYSVPYLEDIVNKYGLKITCSNLFDAKTRQLVFSPYQIIDFGNQKLAFVGVLTPETLSSESYSFFDDQGNKIYDIAWDELAQYVQRAVDDARANGADYVIALSHLGEKDFDYTSSDMIAGTTGIDAVLDAHTHSVVPSQYVDNKEGKAVLCAQTGTKFSNIGKLYISTSGFIEVELLPTGDIPFHSAEVDKVYAEIQEQESAYTGRKCATSECTLSIYAPSGERICRQQECNLGNLICDAMRLGANTQIGIFNGGALRGTINAGDVTYGDIINVVPVEDIIMKVSVTGKQLIDLIENGVAKLPEESGSIVHASGLKYSVCLSKSPRVQTVEVMSSEGTYAPINPDERYSVCVTDYFAGKIKGDIEVLEPNLGVQYEFIPNAVANELGGYIGKEYAETQGRIVILE